MFSAEISIEVEIAAIAICLAFMFFLSIVEAAINQSSQLTLRTMVEQQDVPSRLVPVIVDDRTQVMVPLHLGTQLSQIAIAILTTHLSLQRWPSLGGVAYSFAVVFGISVLFRQMVPRLLTQNEPERKLTRLLRIFHPMYRVLRSIAMPLWRLLEISRRFHEKSESAAEPADEEATDKEMQAYLEIGEDEGIIEEADSKLIQSVVEFGDTLAREVMTPRTRIVACEDTTTLAQLRDVMVQHKHSRIPIYKGDIDHIIGIAYIRHLLAECAGEKENEPVSGIVHPALFVPETKLVSALLKELQERGDHAAIVVDEFGGVAGLVTIEDLVEEIVGEIHDEDQLRVSEIVEEEPGTFVLRGSTELSRLEELWGKRFDGVNASTVAGLVTGYLGRVPAPGEEFDFDGLRIRIVDADRKRVHKLRIKRIAAGLTNLTG